MEFNWIILFLAALIPLIVGFGWYNPKVFGNIWMRTAEVSEEKLKTGNMLLIFGLSYLFSLFLASALMGIVIHQFGIYGVMEGMPGYMEAGTDIQNYIDDFFSNYGNNHRNFGHGVFHGVIITLTFALPLIAINAMFERRGWKYIWIHFGYWLISISLMGGVICHFM